MTAAALPLPLVPPAPRPPLRPLGTWTVMRTLRRNILEVWPERAYEEPITGRRTFGVMTYLVNDPASVRQVLQVNALNYAKTVISQRLLRPVAGDGVLLSEGEAWRRQRRMLAPAFTPAHVAALLPHFTAAAQGLETGIGDGRRVNLAQGMQETALDAACRSLFSMPIGGHGARLAALAREFGDGPGRPGLLDSLARDEHAFPLFAGPRARFKRRWMREVDAIVAERRQAGAPPGGARDLLDLLLAARDPDTGAGLGDAEVRDQSSTLLAAGFETTSRGLFWTAYLLARDPEEQARIRAEVDAAPPHDAMDLAWLQRWPRLRQAIYEAMRLYPPVPAIPRVAVGPDRILGHPVAAGDVIIISPWVLHRHKRLWDRPEAFVPDRFAGKAQAYLTQGAYLPFGAGPRICIGAIFAMTEMSLVLARLIRGYEIALDDDRPLLPRGAVSTTPTIEPWFRLTPR